MRIAFMGTPDFAVPALRALHHAGHDIAAVYCQPARPAGRGQAVRRCPVHTAADILGIPVRTPARLRADVEAQAAFDALNLDAAVVAAYGLILPQAMLDAPARGCLNIHASLLPRWRGAAPIQAAILAGDAETGITIMQMEAGLDTGPMLLRQSVPITPETTAATLHDALAAIGASLILDALTSAPPPVPQREADATYAPKLSREDGLIDWSNPATAIDRQIRAFDPWPGTFTTIAGVPLKVLAAKPVDGTGEPGAVLDANLTVACGGGAVRLTRVQLPGRGALAADAFLRGHAVPPGTVLGR
ncbi:MAG: methionyl-tRNA formyltransferase [Acetobacteraceae bacterium]|jgi:methionyl-tRNA formyltransferase|nr:methionyl-tRNA formyltransferase [Acetobacteraceae bacterium]